MSKRFLWVFLFPAVALTAVLLGAGGAAGGGQEETAGNNLSLPVIWGESAQLPLRGIWNSPVFDGEYTLVGNVPYYEQQDPFNSWQAESKSYSQWLPVTWIDWGDNLESQDWKTTSKVRIETVLYKDLGVADWTGFIWPKMLGFEMAYLYGAGTTEIWGTNGLTYLSDQATIYSDHARLTIQKVADVGVLQNGDLTWDTSSNQWVGADVQEPDFNGGCWEDIDGPGGYSAEINVSGKAIYGYNWDVRTTSNGEAGVYRITFSLDPNYGSAPLRTLIDSSAQIKPTTVEGETSILLTKGPGGGGGKTGGGGTAMIDPANNLTYIEVTIKAGGRGRR